MNSNQSIMLCHLCQVVEVEWILISYVVLMVKSGDLEIRIGQMKPNFKP